MCLANSIEIAGYWLRACLGNGGIKWMEEDWRGFWKILTYNGNFSTPIPFIPIHSTNSQTNPNCLCIVQYMFVWCDRASDARTNTAQYTTYILRLVRALRINAAGPISYGPMGRTCCFWLQENQSLKFFYIFNLSLFLKNKWLNQNFRQMYIWRRGPRRRAPATVPEGVKSMPSWDTAARV
jgi:hypothetical protein